MSMSRSKVREISLVLGRTKMGGKGQSLFLFVCLSVLCLSPSSRAQQFTIGDGNSQINNSFFGNLNPGSSITFQGNLTVSGAGMSGAAVDIDPEVSGLTLTFESSSSTTSTDSSGVFTAAVDGLLENNGTISGTLAGVEIEGSLDGTIRNNGTISGISEGIFIDATYGYGSHFNYLSENHNQLNFIAFDRDEEAVFNSEDPFYNYGEWRISNNLDASENISA